MYKKLLIGIAISGILIFGIIMISCDIIGPLEIHGLPCDNENRGDINSDGIAFSVADAVVYLNYFMFGLNAFGSNYERAIENSDINGDGQVLTLPDFVLLIKIMIGDGSPTCPKELNLKHIEYEYENNGVLYVSDKLGALYIELDSDVEVELLDENMELRSNANRIIIYSLEGNSFIGQILHFSANIVKIEAATDEGDPVIMERGGLVFAKLFQNYPNPFNKTTCIRFCFRKSSDYILTIYDEKKRIVDAYSGNADLGCYEIIWNTEYHASGIYYYNLTAGSFSETKRMLLIK